MKINIQVSTLYEQLEFAIEHYNQMLKNAKYNLACQISNYLNNINFARHNTFFKWLMHGFKIENVKEISHHDILDFFESNNTDTKNIIDVSILIYIPYNSDYWINHAFSNKHIIKLVSTINKLNVFKTMLEYNNNESIKLNEEEFELIFLYD